MPKIPIVEDEEMSRDSLSRLLQRRGYEVLLVVDGEQAWPWFRRRRPI